MLLTNMSLGFICMDAAVAVKVPDALRHPADKRALHHSSNLQAMRQNKEATERGLTEVATERFMMLSSCTPRGGPY